MTLPTKQSVMKSGQDLFAIIVLKTSQQLDGLKNAVNGLEDTQNRTCTPIICSDANQCAHVRPDKASLLHSFQLLSMAFKGDRLQESNFQRSRALLVLCSIVSLVNALVSSVLASLD